jgi:hypothetical protein
MKRAMKLLMVASAAMLIGLVWVNSDLFAQDGSQNGVRGAGFVDENGDGYNDNAPDHDGDGIPNRLDPDYVPVNPEQEKGRGFIDEDGDGINDRIQDADGDGIPNCQDPDWVKPEDGTGNQFGKTGQNGHKGFGTRGTGDGSGDCDLTGPKGTKHGKSGK